jgi:PKHD-type hydroxylase
MRGTERIRKLSFSLQLSDGDDYEGGQFQLMTESGKIYTAPKKRGTLIIFDARANHRVRKVTNGTRKSIVGWIVGPRWK